MRQQLLKVDSDRDAMQRIEELTGRVADILAEVDGISVQDRLSLQWHLSLIHQIASDRRKLEVVCGLPRFDRDPPGAA